mmetsp:Transcript_26364/g.76088  ORF Transcript_26364/g.76088 Transcript_26364/m.76088 type:complete len:200 (+) Transcript_26364:254-853(+)
MMSSGSLGSYGSATVAGAAACSWCCCWRRYRPITPWLQWANSSRWCDSKSGRDSRDARQAAAASRVGPGSDRCELEVDRMDEASVALLLLSDAGSEAVHVSTTSLVELSMTVRSKGTRLSIPNHMRSTYVDSHHCASPSAVASHPLLLPEWVDGEAIPLPVPLLPDADIADAADAAANAMDRSLPLPARASLFRSQLLS